MGREPDRPLQVQDETDPARSLSLVNQAALYQLRQCLMLLDRLGCKVSAIHVSSAIDAFAMEALTEDEMKAFETDEHVRMALDIFAKRSDKDVGADSESE